jgi:hypothetical protein
MMQTPFDRLLGEVARQAQQEPLAAFGRLQECYNKSLTDQDVRNLGGFAANIGGTVLGRWDDAITFIQSLFDHPALEAEGETARSLWRALACLQHCAGHPEAVAEAVEKGVQTDAERVRVSVLTAQMLSARARSAEAIPLLQEVADNMDQVPEGDEVRIQAAQVAIAVSNMAEQQLAMARELILASSSVGVAALTTSPRWQERHRSLYQRGHAFVLAGKPREALDVVASLMAVEEEAGDNVGDLERFFTASLACRAQVLRGQMRVAAAAHEACTDYAGRIVEPQLKQMVDPVLAGLTKVLQNYGVLATES